MKNKGKQPLVFLLLAFFVLSSIAHLFKGPTIEAQIYNRVVSSEPVTLDIIEKPIIFEETTNYVKLNFHIFIVEFYKGSSGYNKIYDMDGNILVYDDRMFLEYFASPKWKQRGTPVNVTWAKISDYYYTVTRNYDDYLGTTYSVTYIVKSSNSMKIVLTVDCGATDFYRVAWTPSGITKDDWHLSSNRLVFGTVPDVGQQSWIGFDWGDVYQTFGEITTTNVETVAQGKKANIYFEIGTVEAGTTIIVDPTTVGTATDKILYAFQEKIGYDLGKWWYCYSDGTNAVIRTSDDGVSWSSATTLREGITNSRNLGLWFDTSNHKLHYAFYNNTTTDTLLYRQCTLHANATFTWDATEQSVDSEDGSYFSYPTVCVDNNGYPWIGHTFHNGTFYARVYKSSTKDGIWTTASSFPFDVANSGSALRCNVIPLSSGGKVVAVYAIEGDVIGACLWGGSSWGTPDTGGDIEDAYAFDIVVDSNDNVHCVFNQDVEYDLQLMSFDTSSETWGSPADFKTETDNTWCPTLAIDTSNDHMYCFYGVDETNHVYYMEYTPSIGWDSEQDWIDESTDGLYTDESLVAGCQDYGGKLLLMYSTGSGSPYNVRGAYLIVGSSVDAEIGTSADVWATGIAYQGHVWYANGRHWASYCDNTNLGHRSSTDASTWGDFTEIRACTDGWQSALDFDGSYIHYEYSPYYENSALNYRMGAPESDGSITWQAVEQDVEPADSDIRYEVANIVTDSNGYPWIAYRKNNATASKQYPWVTSSSTKNGVWTTASGFPYQLNSEISTNWYLVVVPLSNAQMLAVYTNQTHFFSQFYNGATWEGENITDVTDLEGQHFWDAVGYQNTVHIAWLSDVSYNLLYTNVTSGVWSGVEDTIQAGVTSTSCPSLTLDESATEIYCFWLGSPKTNYVYYKKYAITTDAWDPSPTEWVHEIDILYNGGHDRITSSYMAYSGIIGVCWLSGTASPFGVRYYYLSVNQAPTNEGVTITNMDDTNFMYSLKRYYQFEGKYNDSDGPSSFDHVMVAFSDGSTWVNVTFDMQLDSWSLVSGSTLADIDSSSCTNTTSGNQLTATFHIRLWWNINDASNLELYQFCNDTSGASDPWEEKQTNYVNIETDLSVSGFACDDDRGSLSQTITFTGTVYYEGTSTYPPDSAFTAVHIYDSGDNDKGSDSSIVNGAFSVAFNAPASVGTETYNSYIDMAHASYSDGEDANTDAFISDNIQVTFSVNNTSPTKGETVLFTVTLTREHDSTNVTSFSFNVNRNDTGFSNPHTTTTFTDTNSTEVVYVYDFTAVTDNTYAITSFTDPNDLTVSWLSNYPTIGNFEATSRIYGSEYGRLNVTIVDADNNITAGTITFVNCTLQISGQIVLLWTNATGTFSIYQNTLNYLVDLDTSNCLIVTVNTTAYTLSWYVKFGNNYGEGYKGAIATNTLVYDDTGLSGSGSQNNYFFYDAETTSQGGFQWTPSPPEIKPENFTWGELPYYPKEPYVAPTGLPLELGLWTLIGIVGGVMVLGLASRYGTKPRRSTKKRTHQKRSKPRDYDKRTKRKR